MRVDMGRRGCHVAECRIGASEEGVHAWRVEPVFQREGGFRECTIRIWQAVGVGVGDDVVDVGTLGRERDRLVKVHHATGHVMAFEQPTGAAE